MGYVCTNCRRKEFPVLRLSVAPNITFELDGEHYVTCRDESCSFLFHPEPDWLIDSRQGGREGVTTITLGSAFLQHFPVLFNYANATVRIDGSTALFQFGEHNLENPEFTSSWTLRDSLLFMLTPCYSYVFIVKVLHLSCLVLHFFRVSF